LAMGQFSPRIVQTFLKDRPSQLAIGLFVATFAHAMIAMREVGFEGEGQVPGIAIAVGYILVLTSIAMLVLYVDHIGRSLRVSSLIELVGSDTRDLLERTYPDSVADVTTPDPTVVAAPESGVVVTIDNDELVEVAREAGCTLHVVVALGTFVPAGAPLMRIEGPTERVDVERAIGALQLGLERTLDQDVAYGFRMLVDMAERSLSDSPFLDPTTAVQCLDRLHDGLRQLAVKEIPDGSHDDPAGRLRVTVPSMTWDDYVHLAFDEIRLAGTGSPQVTRRMLAAIDDLLTVAPPDRRAVLEEQADLLHQGVAGLTTDERDRTMGLTADAAGISVNGRAKEPAAVARNGQ